MQIKLIIIFFFFFFSTFSQVNGKVVTKKGNFISNVFVQLIERETDLTEDYTSTDEKGYFSLHLPKTQKEYYLKVTLLGYKPKKVAINKNNISNLTIILEEERNVLKEIIITSTYKEFQTKKDTIVYNISKVKDSTENNLKDFIEKLPSLTIDNNNKVNFQGKVIDKVIIDGEDFFGKKHEMSTENLSAEAIKGIQIIKNFKEFDDIGKHKTGKIVLNVTLNKNYKNKIVGNLEGNSGVAKKNQFHSNFFKFIKKGNFALITEANNIGESAINMLDYIEMQGGIDNFTKNFNESFGIYELDHSKIPRYVFVDKNVDARSTIFNSLNFSNKVSEKIKINGYLALDYTKIKELKNTTKNFISSNLERLQENESNSAKSYLGNSFVNLVYKKNKTQVLKYNLKINSLKNEEFFKITGGLNIDNLINDNDFLIGQSLVYKNQLTAKLFLQSTLSYNYKIQERNFTLNSDNTFLNLSFSDDFNLVQNTNVKQKSLNINSKLLYSFSERMKLTTSISLINNKENFYNQANNQADFLFDIKRKQINYSFLNTINVKLNNLFSLNASLKYIRNNLNINNESKKYNWFLPNFSLGFKFSNEKDLSVSYAKSMKNASIFQINNNYRVLNYQTKINKNKDVFTSIENKTISLIYNAVNSQKNSMFNFRGSFFEIKNDLGYNSIFKNNFLEQSYVRIPKRGYDLSINHSKTIRFFPLKWAANLFYKTTKSLSFLNLEDNNNKIENFGIDVRFNSNFKKSPFQSKINIYYSETNTRNHFSFLDYSLKRINIYPKIYGKVKKIIWSLGCKYQNVASKNTSQNIYGTNFSTQWNFSKEIQLFFKGDNIFNLKSNQFISQQNTEVFSQLTYFERLEGNILVGMRYNF